MLFVRNTHRNGSTVKNAKRKRRNELKSNGNRRNQQQQNINGKHANCVKAPRLLHANFFTVNSSSHVRTQTNNAWKKTKNRFADKINKAEKL